MSLPLSNRARLILEQQQLPLQIILEIEGFEGQAIFGAVDVEKFARIGEDGLTIGSFYIGGTIVDSRSRPWVSSKGSSTKVSQQVLPDKEGTTSVQKLRIHLVDKDGELTRMFAPGIVVPDLMGVRARVFVGFAKGAHPEDSIRVLSGTIDDYDFGAGWVKLTVAHPEGKKKQDLFTSRETALASGISNSDVTVPLVSVAGLFEPQDCLRTLILVEDELIEYAGISGNNLTGCTRGVEGTSAAAHGLETDVQSVHILQESAIPLALKLLLSGGEEYFVEDLAIAKFVQIDAVTNIPNAIAFRSDVQTRYNLQVGDLITVADATDGANNFALRTILSFGQTTNAFYIIVDGAALVVELTTSAVASFKSQFNTLPVDCGCGMIPDEVDIERFLFWEDLFGLNFPEYKFELRDAIDAKEFLDKEVYFPAALYCVPRKGRTSVQMNIPPLAIEDVVRLNVDTVCNPSALSIERSTNQFFYNAVDFAYDFDAAEDKFIRRNVLVSQTSLDRIKVGLKKLTIESKGIRRDLDGLNVIETANRRYLDRYKFGAERLKGVQVLYKVGLPLEIGDAVVLEGEGLKISDSRTASRRFAPRLMEVINKDWDYVKGGSTVDLLDTAFELDARYGVVGPSSYLAAGSTTTELVLARSFGTLATQLERDKWSKYVGEVIAIRDDEFNTYYERTFVALHPTRSDVIIVGPALPAPPAAGIIVDMPVYSGDIRTKALWKNIHVYIAPEVEIVSGISGTQFTVAPGDIAKFFVDGQVRVHDEDYDVLSEQVRISEVDVGSNTITLAEDLGFTPAAGQFCNPIGFADDNGLGYNYL
jgi:hypothetical protein